MQLRTDLYEFAKDWICIIVHDVTLTVLTILNQNENFTLW